MKLKWIEVEKGVFMLETHLRPLIKIEKKIEVRSTSAVRLTR